jgi:hypothetical protein
MNFMQIVICWRTFLAADGCKTKEATSGPRDMASPDKRSDRYDPWYTKIAFGLFLCVLVGTLVALYSGVPVPHFIVVR